MASFVSRASSMVFMLQFMFLLVWGTATSSRVKNGSFYQDFDISWAPDHARFLNGGQQMQLLLDRSSGSGFASKKKFLFGNIGMQIKLVPGDSAGTVTAYYLSSNAGPKHDEVDFEFLGNVSGEPYIVQTNIYAHGVGNREQRIYLWFDPTADFHTYSIQWNPQHIIFYVDATPIRVYKNNEAMEVPYLNRQAMGVYSSLWNADDWATQGGLVKTNWSNAPFAASYRNFRVEGACQVRSNRDISRCMLQQTSSSSSSTINTNSLHGEGGSTGVVERKEILRRLNWVRKHYMIYDYCADNTRYPVPPPECRSLML
nr:xyloglucan endotransglucosylase/hydrolase [Larix kaempferi]